MKDAGTRYITGLSFKGLPDTTRDQLAWLQDERGWTNKTTLFVTMVERMYREEHDKDRPEVQDAA